MRISPIPPNQLGPEARYVHDEIAGLTGCSQGPVNMQNAEGALLGPFPPLLQYAQFGTPALGFLRTLDVHATLDKRVREVVILTVGAAFNARFELYAHEIMAKSFGLPADAIAVLAAGGHPCNLNEQENIAHQIAAVLTKGRVIPASTYNHAVTLFGSGGVAEIIFLVSGYSLIAMILNGFDIPAPENDQVNGNEQ